MADDRGSRRDPNVSPLQGWSVGGLRVLGLTPQAMYLSPLRGLADSGLPLYVGLRPRLFIYRRFAARFSYRSRPSILGDGA